MLSARLSALIEALSQCRDYWHPRAFYHEQLNWQQQQPQLWQALQQLDNHQLQTLTYQGLPSELQALLPQLATLNQLCELPHHSGAALEIPSAFADGIGARKWQQINHYVAALTPQLANTPLMDWCGGKGFLAHALAQQHPKLQIHSSDIDEALVLAGNRRAARLSQAVNHHHVDLFSSDANLLCQQQPQAAHSALHACGDLHKRVMALALQYQAPALYVSPCCYQRYQLHDGYYQPQSALARAASLRLDYQDLLSAVTDASDPRPALQQQRHTLSAWRQGFNTLQRQCCNGPEYLPTPPTSVDVLQHGFVAFCQQMALRKQIKLPKLSESQWQDYEQQGWLRHWNICRADLVRLAYRRALECYLVFDHALYLEQQGYQVQVSTFCAAQLTPRNLLISAKRQ